MSKKRKQVSKKERKRLKQMTAMGMKVETFDEFYRMHEEGTDSIVMAAMMGLAAGAKMEPYDYWLELTEEKLTALASFTLLLIEDGSKTINPQGLTWEQVEFHGQLLSEMFEIKKPH